MSKRQIVNNGDKYARLTVIKETESIKSPNGNIRMFLCKCECGNKKRIRIQRLVHGYSKSCGCLQKEVATKNATTHGKKKHPLYSKWCGMKKRCFNTNDAHYKDYGGRGITVCERWMKFENYYKDMHVSYLEHKKNNSYTSIDRINNDGNYEPSNCRWATYKVQTRNKRSNIIVEFNGEKKTIPEWAEEMDMRYMTLYQRFYKGWATERALTTKLITKHKRKKNKLNQEMDILVGIESLNAYNSDSVDEANENMDNLMTDVEQSWGDSNEKYN